LRITIHVNLIGIKGVLPLRCLIPGKYRFGLDAEKRDNLNASLDARIQGSAVSVPPGKGRIAGGGVETQGWPQPGAEKEPVVCMACGAGTRAAVRRFPGAEASGLNVFFDRLGRRKKGRRAEKQQPGQQG
jgi:hypothetical protein